MPVAISPPEDTSGSLQLQSNGANIDFEAIGDLSDPLDTYTAWAAELNVDPISSRYWLDDDDSQWTFALDGPLWPGTQINSAFFSSEAGMGFFTGDAGYPWYVWYDLPGVSRFWGPNNTPPLVIAWHPEWSDLRSVNARCQVRDGTTILYSEYEYYGDPNYNRCSAAIRIQQGNVALHVRTIDTNLPVMVYDLVPGQSWTTVLQSLQAIYLTPQQGARITFQVGAAKAYLLSGTARFTDGAIATRILVTDVETAVVLYDQTPDDEAGGFIINDVKNKPVYVTIFRDGYRPLCHGPISPYEVTPEAG